MITIEPVSPIWPSHGHDSESMTREGWYDRPAGFRRNRRPRPGVRPSSPPKPAVPQRGRDVDRYEKSSARD